jgi:urea transporter
LENKFKNLRETILPAIINSYSVIFFLNNRWMALAVLLASFLNFWAGLSGLLAVIMAVLLADSLGFDKAQLRNGVLSFNALITGIGLGTFFDPGILFFTLLALSTLLTLIISVALGGWMFKYGLPFLSIPFVVTFWFVVLPAELYENLGLTHRNIFWMNEMYSVGGNSLLHFYQAIESWEINKLLDIYLRSLSSSFFQNNLISGIIIAVALLLSSRIFFSLSILGFISAYIFAQFSGSEAATITYYNIGANFIMVAIAVGGFFIIPSKYSYLWTILLVPITSIILVFFIRLFGFAQLPVFSLPYSIVTILFVHFLRQRATEKKLVLTPVQYYSPETNLYAWLNNRERLSRFWFYPLQLPFWGSWTVTQGHDGDYTHKGAWGKALDFMILDNLGKSYKTTGNYCEDYYCYGKPVLSPADGIVAEILDHIEDNEPGQVNTTQNWGNTIVIQHLPGIYTQLSHLKNNSIKVKAGDYVKAGDMIAYCGNSGRSPYPHLHFQVQAYPAIGSKTIDYPLSYYISQNQGKQLKQFERPVLGETLTNLSRHTLLYGAFNILPDNSMEFSYEDEKGNKKTEHWDSYTDAYNYKYLHSRETDAIAYYTCDQMMFYFTTFYGSKKSLLYQFYLIAFKVLLSDMEMKISDKVPIHMLDTHKVAAGINDFVAAFANFVSAGYSSGISKPDQLSDNNEAEVASNIVINLFGRTKESRKGLISVGKSGIISFSYQSGKKTIHALRTS